MNQYGGFTRTLAFIYILAAQIAGTGLYALADDETPLDVLPESCQDEIKKDSTLKNKLSEHFKKAKENLIKNPGSYFYTSPKKSSCTQACSCFTILEKTALDQIVFEEKLSKKEDQFKINDCRKHFLIGASQAASYCLANKNEYVGEDIVCEEKKWSFDFFSQKPKASKSCQEAGNRYFWDLNSCDELFAGLEEKRNSRNKKEIASQEAEGGSIKNSQQNSLEANSAKDEVSK